VSRFRPRRPRLSLRTNCIDKLPPKTKVYLAALRALTHWMPDRRATEALAAAASSKDPDIAAAARPIQETAT